MQSTTVDSGANNSSASGPGPGTSSGSEGLGGISSLKLNDGHEIPMLGYGLGTARSRDESEKIIETTVMAIKNGYYHLDGAQSYGNETELGAAIKQSGIDRSRLFVTTKLQRVRDDVAAAFAASLARLDLAYVDLYLIHSPFGASPAELQAAWAQLEDIRASGRARSIGVSNFSAADLAAVLATARVPPAVNQIEYHPYLQHEPDGLLAFCRERGVAVAAYAPLTAITRARPGPCDDVYAALARRHGGE
ncbi:NADP-dependent oxidoreductase domain-containing protein [Nemania sp. NC0429]|nr:NADP-dependent oxidoreductase domain-containing protein [Nemania sp. NC0429]